MIIRPSERKSCDEGVGKIHWGETAGWKRILLPLIVLMSILLTEEDNVVRVNALMQPPTGMELIHCLGKECG